MAKTTADLMAETLTHAGVKRIYGVVGDSLNGFTDALRRLKVIDWVHMRHEEGAAFAAGAEAHLTGELAVCAGSCGPGNLHLINGLFDCHRSGVPVLAIAAHIPSTEIGSDYFQATHPEALFKECSHYVELVSNPNLLPQILNRAIRVAIAKRGVAVVVIPGDIALKPATAAVANWLVPARPVVRQADLEIDKLAGMLNGAEWVRVADRAADPRSQHRHARLESGQGQRDLRRQIGHRKARRDYVLDHLGHQRQIFGPRQQPFLPRAILTNAVRPREHYAVSDRETGVAGILDDTGALVAEHQRRLGPRVPT